MTPIASSPKTRRYWSQAELLLLTLNYADSLTADIAAVIGRSASTVANKAYWLGLHKSAAYLASPAACRIRSEGQVGNLQRFPKGHVPANKGLRRPGWTAGDMARTQFKPGTLNGRAAQLVLPLGSYRVNADGWLDKKISEAPGAQTLRWKAVHRIVWEAAHGPIPATHIVRFKDGRRTTDLKLITPDALELITRRENMARNTVHNLPRPVVEIARLRAVLTREINKQQRSDPA